MPNGDVMRAGTGFMNPLDLLLDDRF